MSAAESVMQWVFSQSETVSETESVIQWVFLSQTVIETESVISVGVLVRDCE